MINLFRQIKLYCFIFLGVLLIFFIALSAMNSQGITAIKIKLKDGVEEVRDRTLLGVDNTRALPDYQLKLNTSDGWKELGTKRNTSAVQWLEYPVKQATPLRSAIELQIIEDDRIKYDVLEQVQIPGESFSGRRFEYELVTERSFEAGMRWFFDTPFGKAIAAGIAIAVIIACLGAFT